MPYGRNANMIQDINACVGIAMHSLELQKALKLDTISELTPASGVTIDGVKLKDSVPYCDTITEKTATAGVTIDGVKLKDSQPYCDVINEKTAATGVTIDSVVLKDGLVDGYDVANLAESQTSQILITAAVDGASTDTWERATFVAPRNITILSAGIMSTTAFGQATNYATLTFTDKGSAGAGTDTVAAKAFDTAITALDYVDFGSITNADLVTGDTITLVKSVTGTGQAVPAYVIAVIVWKPR